MDQEVPQCVTGPHAHSSPRSVSMGIALYESVITLHPEKKALEELLYTFNELLLSTVITATKILSGKVLLFRRKTSPDYF